MLISTSVQAQYVTNHAPILISAEIIQSNCPNAERKLWKCLWLSLHKLVRHWFCIPPSKITDDFMKADSPVTVRLDKFLNKVFAPTK